MVSVPSSRVQTQPGSDVLLGCHFFMGVPVELMELVVQWKLGNRLVAEFDNIPSYRRPGASLSREGLQVGNASLLLPRVGGADAGLYTCVVIVPPSRESRQVELRVEGNCGGQGPRAEPRGAWLQGWVCPPKPPPQRGSSCPLTHGPAKSPWAALWQGGGGGGGRRRRRWGMDWGGWGGRGDGGQMRVGRGRTKGSGPH